MAPIEDNIDSANSTEKSHSTFDDYSITSQSATEKSLDSIHFHKKNYNRKKVKMMNNQKDHLDALPSGSGSKEGELSVCSSTSSFYSRDKRDDDDDNDNDNDNDDNFSEEDTYDDILGDDVTYDTSKMNDKDLDCGIDCTTEIGNILSERTAQIKNKITTGIDKLKISEAAGNINVEELGKRVHDQLAHVLNVAKTTSDTCGNVKFVGDEEEKIATQREAIMKELQDNDKENKTTEQKVRSILKQPHVRRFSRDAASRSSKSSTKNGSVPGKDDKSLFQVDWSLCTIESEEEKTARELQEARQEILNLRDKLKEMQIEKRNVESQLEFAKLALENLNNIGSDGFSQTGKDQNSICQTLDIDNGDVGVTPKQLRRNIFQRR
jgi:peroxiredoxin family protein